MLIWILLALGILIIVARALFGHKAALMLLGLWLAIAIFGWATGTGVRR